MAGEVATVSTNDVKFAGYDTVLTKINAEKEENSGTNIVMNMPPEENLSAEVQFGLDKILNSDSDNPTEVAQVSRKAVADVEATIAQLAELDEDTPDAGAEEQKEVKKEEPVEENLPEPMVVTNKTDSEQLSPKEEKVSLLAELFAEVESNKNNPSPKKTANKFDDRADKAIRGIGDGIVSPIKALFGIKDVMTGEFNEGQEEIRNAVADFANTPAQAVNFVATGLEASVNDLAGETAGKVVLAPLKAVSGIWETGVALVKPEEGSVKKTFNKITFGLFN